MPDRRRRMILSRSDHITVLLGGLERDFSAVETHYRAAKRGGVVSDELQLSLLDYSVHARAVLDYLIKEIAKRSCGASRTRLNFPIASLTEPRPAFEARLRGLLPGLDAARPKLFDYLVSLQHYSDGPWLTQLQDLSNESKHEKLATPVLGKVAAFVAEYKGAGIAVGDSGDCLTLEIRAGASLGLRGADGVTKHIRGPQRIDRDTRDLADADPEILFERREWLDFKFDPGDKYSAMHLLRTLRTKIPEIVKKVRQLLGP